MKHPHDKGKRGEYFVRDLLKGFGYEARRTPMSGAIDFMKGDLITNFPFFCEVKNTKKTKFDAWYKKASQQAGALPPVVIWTKSHDDAYCYLNFSDFLMSLQGKTPLPLSKPQKTKKLSKEETTLLPFSKAKQLHKN